MCTVVQGSEGGNVRCAVRCRLVLTRSLREFFKGTFGTKGRTTVRYRCHVILLIPKLLPSSYPHCMDCKQNGPSRKVHNNTMPTTRDRNTALAGAVLLPVRVSFGKIKNSDRSSVQSHRALTTKPHTPATPPRCSVGACATTAAAARADSLPPPGSVLPSRFRPLS